MKRSLLLVLGLGAALGACGKQFAADLGAGGNGGASSAARDGLDTAGASAHAGTSNDDNAGSDAEAGAAGAFAAAGSGVAGTISSAGTGGVLSTAGGTGGVLSTAGGTGGLLGTTGGTSSVSGAGGALAEPELPQLGLLVWLRADLGIQQKDGHVQLWQDQSGNQTNASQASIARRPAYLATGFNGRPTLEFDGQQQFLKFGDGFGNFRAGLTGFIVARPTASDCASMVELSNGSEVDDIALGMWQNQWTYEVDTPFMQGGDVDPERFALYAVNHRVVGQSELRIDGNVLDMLDMPLPALPDTGIRVNNFVGHTLYGSCAYFEGQISEIILYSRTLPTADVRAIEKYLDAHWALSEQATPAPAP